MAMHPFLAADMVDVTDLDSGLNFLGEARRKIKENGKKTRTI
jgi:hypothetical protein